MVELHVVERFMSKQYFATIMYDKKGIILIVLGIVLILLLSVVKTDVDHRDAALCQAYSQANMDMSTCPAHTANTSWYLTLLFGVAFCLMGIGGYAIVQAKPKKTPKLNNDEQKILRILDEKEGSCYQSDIVNATEFSKVKVTRVLDKLEHAGVIERKRRGMTNMVVRK